MLRHQLIESLIPPHTEPVAEVAKRAVAVWERTANEIIAIIGVGGFNSLFARSVFLSRPSFPYLAPSALPLQVDQCLAELKKSLENQTPADAIRANIQLLCTFTDILATLIGEELTSSILQSAWSHHVPDKINKGSKND